MQRELRESARRPLNHWLRLGSAVGGVALFCLICPDPGSRESDLGIHLFTNIHALVLVLIFCLIPVTVAERVARERREETLGLLFLTPLTPSGVVAGKCLAVALNFFTLWLALFPLLTIPFLTGGINWNCWVAAVSVEFSFLLLCFAVGLLASALTKTTAGTFIMSMCVAVLLVFVMAEWMTFMVAGVVSFPYGLSPIEVITGSEWNGYWSDDIWTYISSQMTGAQWLSTFATGVAGAFIACVLVAKFAALRLAQSWRDKPPSIRKQKLEKQYCTPVLHKWFACYKRRAMSVNPVVWLVQYSWRARLLKWLLCLVCCLVECAVVYVYGKTGEYGEWQSWQQVLFFGLLIIVVFVATVGISREKHSGALELILVSPLSVRQIILGRVFGLWRQFLPTVLVITGSYCVILRGQRYYEAKTWFPFWVVVDFFVVLPFLSFYFALAFKNVVAAIIANFGVMFISAEIGLFWARFVIDDRGYETILSCSLAAIAGIAPIGAAAYFRLWHNLSRRVYSL
jgi:ABC-type transport system involved in multi-copper enzyme maturation permease subunit